MLRYSTIIAALILAGSAVTASAASKTAHHRYHGLYMQAPTSGPATIARRSTTRRICRTTP